MKTNFLICFLTFFCYNLSAQINLYNDIYRGGVTSFGASTVDGLSEFEFILNDFSQNSVRKVFLTYYAVMDENYILSDTHTFSLNNDTITMSKNQDWNHFTPSDFNSSPSNPFIGHISFFKDITEDFNNINDTVFLKWLTPFQIPISCVVCHYGAPMITILYENDTMDMVNYQLIINNEHNGLSKTINVNNLNAMSAAHDIGLGIQSDRVGGNPLDGYDFSLNSNYIGRLSKHDSTNPLGGVMGCFYYENGVLTGLTDDVANDSLKGSDGILKINNYLTNNTGFNLKYDYIQNTTWYPHNYLIALHLAYSTPCDTFTTLVKDKIQVCKGDSIQMQVTSAPLSNHTYEWEPQEGLSCYNCAQPYFTDTVSRWYTVRVWNNDSCSKVLPVRVEVFEKPLNPIVSVSPTKCSDSSGIAQVQMIDNTYQYSLNNGAAQTSNIFNNLYAGVHTVNVIDTNGCQSSTPITIAETYPNAVFSATPQQGDVPLEVSFYNTSTGANNFIWYIEQDTLTSVNAVHTFNTEGFFDATLVAYDTYPWCSDTASVSIFAEYPFVVFAPSLHADREVTYQVYTSGVTEMTYQLYNDIGQQIFSKKINPTNGNNDIWQAHTIAKGIYFYRIIATDDAGNEKEISGKVVVI